MLTYRSSATRLARAIVAAAAVCAVSAASAADDPAAEASADTARAATPIPLNSGAVPEEFPADPSKVTLERHADGTRVYHMNGQGMEAVTAHIGADGKLQLRCTDAADQRVPPTESAHAN